MGLPADSLNRLKPVLSISRSRGAMSIIEQNVFAVVVTYNRKSLLVKCLESLLRQTRPLTSIVVVDNASTDGTGELLLTTGWLDNGKIELLSQPENLGGSGGFVSGIKHALDKGADWAWIMDDDALPEAKALEHLLQHVSHPTNLYGSVAIDDQSKLSWILTPTSSVTGARKNIHYIEEIPETLSVAFLPFLGLLIGKKLVEQIGLPDEKFFLAADDVDYCLRARANGASIVAVGSSRLQHPAAEAYPLNLPWRKLWCVKLPPWKRYYDVRNRLFVARNHYGPAIYYQTIPGSFLRLVATLLCEDEKINQLKAFYAGMVDGLRGKKGRRHELWGL